jgi:hypothetical protein
MKQFFKWAARRPVWVLVITAFITVLAVLEIRSNVRMETNLDEYMPKDHPAFVYSDKADERFRIRDAILIAVEHPVSVYNPETLGKIVALEDDLAQFKEIEAPDIRSLHTADNIVGSADGLDVRKFYTDVPTTAQEAAAIGQMVRENTMVYGRLVSKDEKTTLVIVDLAKGRFSQDLYNRILSLAKKYQGPERIYVAGRPIVEGTMAILGPRDMARMGPLVILVITLVLFLVLRRLSRTILVLAVVLCSTLWAFGLMLAVGVPIYTVSIMIPVMLIAIGVAYGIHLYNQIDYFTRQNPNADRYSVVTNVIDVIFSPVLFAALTTMAGFISLLTSQVFPVKWFGVFSAFGVLMELILTMLLIPAGIMLFGTKKGAKSEVKKTVTGSSISNDGTKAVILEKPNGLGSRFADTVIAHPRWVILGVVVVVALSVFGLSRVWINSSFLANFEKNSDIVTTDAFINKNFGGTSTLNVIFDSSDPDTFKKPALLNLLNDAQKGVLTLDKVGDATSITDYLRRMNRVMHEDRMEFDTIPDDQNLIAQYLLLYEMSGDPDNLWKVVDSDYRGANLTVQLKSDDTQTIRRVVAYFDSYASKFAEQGVGIHYAGSGYKSMVFADLILQGQISSLWISVLIVILLVALMFKSWSLGFIAAIPVTIAMLANFGVMGLLNIPLTTSTAIISSIAVGIGVDYGIHFIERYRETLKETKDPVVSGQFSMGLTGRAVFLNAAIVIAGFMVLLFSVFPPNRQVGALVSFNMVIAFVGTVTIMFLVLRHTYTSVKEQSK